MAAPLDGRQVQAALVESVADGHAQTPELPEQHSEPLQHRSLHLKDRQQEEEQPQRLHHLLRHHLPQRDRGGGAVAKLGAADVQAAEAMVRSMVQPELRAAFLRIYGAPTNSFNNTWLRSKLYEALGVVNAVHNKLRKPRRGAVAKQQRERRQEQKEKKEARRAAAEDSAAEALAEIAAGSPLKRRAAPPHP